MKPTKLLTEFVITPFGRGTFCFPYTVGEPKTCLPNLWGSYLGFAALLGIRKLTAGGQDKNMETVEKHIGDTETVDGNFGGEGGVGQSGERKGFEGGEAMRKGMKQEYSRWKKHIP